MTFPVLKNRMDLIGPLIRAKSVLDLGCVDHDLKQLAGSWLHRAMGQEAREVIGVDFLPEAVEELQAMGYHAVCQNVEDLHLDRSFDVAVAGEIIEHLANPGRFLEGVHRHLKENGLFILTTPNPFSIAQCFKILKRNKIKVNPEHTAWFDPQTIQTLLLRYGFKVENIYWLDDFKRFRIRSFFAKLRPYWSAAFLVVSQKR